MLEKELGVFFPSQFKNPAGVPFPAEIQPAQKPVKTPARMPREDRAGESPDAQGTPVQRTLTDLWSIDMNSVRTAALLLPQPSSALPVVLPGRDFLLSDNTEKRCTQASDKQRRATAGAAGKKAAKQKRARARHTKSTENETDVEHTDGEAESQDMRTAEEEHTGLRTQARGHTHSTPVVAAGKKAAKKPRARARKAKRTDKEIDIENTEGETESEEVETAQDREFIDTASQDEHAGEHAAFDNSRDPENMQRPAREEPDFPSEKKKTRSERRVLIPVPERGMAEAERQVSDYCYKAPYGLPTPNRLVTPYWKQPGHELVNNQLVSGAFGSNQHRTWCNDKRAQSDFASLFCAPWKENIPLRAVSTDIADTVINPLACSTNSTAQLLHAIKISHKQTELDVINGKFIQHVFVGLQHTSRELALAMHSGPFGGMQGKADVVLWNMRHGDEVSNTNADILNLIELIRCAAAPTAAPRASADCV